MSFLTPVWLLLGALAAYIFILHMRRRRQLDVPSVMIWRLMENNLTPHRALRWPPPSVLLLLQLLILFLVALALAQPLIGTQRGEDDHTIFVLDASASMRATDEAPSRFDAAKAFLTRAVGAGTDESSGRMSVVTADAQPRVAIARQAAPGPILATIGTLGVTDGIVDWNATASAIAPLIQPGENTEIVVLTDGTDAGEAMLATLLPGATVERAVFASEAPENLGLTATIAPIVNEAPAEGEAAAVEVDMWRVTGTVLFGSPDVAEAVVTVFFQPAGTGAFVDLTETVVARPSPTQADIAAGVVQPVPLPAPFTIDVELPGAGLVMLQLPDDAGPADNTVRFDIRSEPVGARVLYIGDTALPLLAALQSIEGVEVIGASALPANDRAYDLVVADNVILDRAPETNVLWVGAARLLSQAEPTLLDSPDVIGWDADHPLSHLVDWTALQAELGYRFPRLPGAAVLAESGGAPLVQARTTPFGREVRVAFDIPSSGWTNEPGFPVFVSHVVDWLGTNVGTTIQPTCVVGEPCPIEARLLGGTVTDAEGNAIWTGNLAEGAAYLLPGIERSFVPARAGYYTLTAGEETRTITVNPMITGEVALKPLESSLATVTSAGGGTQLWWPLLFIALILLLIETWLAGRGSEQFLRGTALARSNPLFRRRRLQLGLRIGAAILFVAALAGLPWLGREPVEDTIVVMGTDLPTGEANPDRDRLLQAVNQNLAGGGRGGLIRTGEDNRIAADIGGAAPGEAAAGTQGTNLEDAMLLAAAMVPSDRQGRIVLATDGNETEGELAQAIATLQARGLVVDIEPVTDMPAGEVLVEEIAAPPRVYEGDAFKLDAVIYSQGAATADLVIRRAGEVIGEQTTELLAGRNRIEIPMVPAGPAGTLLIEVAVTTPGDTFAENNTNGVIVNVMPTPAILIVTPQPPLGEYFSQALSVQGLSAEITTPAESPDTIDGWLAYDSVILMNVPAIDLDTERQGQLEEFVQLHGRGLLILGGENAFGPGGYYGTPLERISPLSSLVPHEMPEVSIVYVIDRSGSMSAQVEDLTRLDIAKSSTMSAIGLLSPQSNFAIVVFDSSAYTLVPLQPLNIPAAEAALAPLIPGGGTNIYPGFEQALGMLARSQSATKHIVIMTDGITAAADFPTLVEIAQDLGVTVSTIAIGVGDDERLAGIAAETGGEYYATADFQLMPSILAQETLMLAGSPFEERIAPVQWSARDFDFLAGLPDALPPVYSYVLTTAKPQADVHLTVADEEGDAVPLLATWRYGNGHVLALATHGAGAGTAEWIQMPEYPLMWAQVIRSFLPDPVGPGLNVTLNRTGDAVAVVADYLDPAGAPLDHKTPAATVTSPSGAAMIVALSETTAGRYEGLFTATEQGAYHVEVAADEETGAADTYVAYPARFNFGRADFDKLQALAEATGGQLLLGDEPVFNNETQWVAQPGWRIWTLVALVFFLADLTIRHAPNLFGLIRRRQPAPGPALAVPA